MCDLIVRSNKNKELQIAALKALGGFQLGSISSSTLIKICGLLVPMLIDGTEEERLSATMALCSCIHNSHFWDWIKSNSRIDAPKLVDTLMGYLEGNRIGVKLSCIRGLAALTDEVIKDQPRVGLALVNALGDENPIIFQEALWGILKFCQSDVLRASIEGTPVIRSLLNAVTSSPRGDLQVHALRVLEDLMQHSECDAP
ncbi:hypothetical protein BD779DRAFT_693214 [Infundibulicybe gibba]|nr:hypothetical protein BD779DRAFT_693214 [Infundibulicybe gibba]